jgi:hypothetical protein
MLDSSIGNATRPPRSAVFCALQSGRTAAMGICSRNSLNVSMGDLTSQSGPDESKSGSFDAIALDRVSLSSN